MVADRISRRALSTLLQSLQDQSAVLSTTVDIAHVNGSCYGYVFLKNRTIFDCQIQSQDGRVLYRGQQAYEILSMKTQWNVRFASPSGNGITSSEPQEAPSFPDMPQVRAPLEASLSNEYTTKQRVILRTVFAMINGQRSIAQMKERLNLSPKAVDEALAVLRTMGVIE